MAELSFAGINWEELLLRLTNHASALFGWFPDGDEKALPGDGSGPDDLAMTVLVRFLDPDDRTVRWKTGQKKLTQTNLLAYLKVVLHHDFLDLKRSKRYRTTVHDSAADLAVAAEKGLSLEEFCAKLGPEGQLIHEQKREHLLRDLADDPGIQELLIVQLEPDGYQAFTNQDLASLFEISVAEVVNRKKRLSRRLRRMLAAAEGK